MLGYIGVPNDKTFSPEGFFCTGDGGHIDDRGRLVWEGRLNDIIKTGGANVSPIEVDATLEGYPGIKLSRTVGVPHDTLGEIVVTCLVQHEDAGVDPAAVTAFLKMQLASYKVPRAIVMIEESDISLTGSAKVKTGALRELVATRLDTTKIK